MDHRSGVHHGQGTPAAHHEIFATIEKWLANKTKFEAVDILRKFDMPCSRC